MEYKNRDLKIEDLVTNYNRINRDAFLLDTLELVSFLRTQNPKKKYYSSTSIGSKEWKQLLTQYNETRILKAYEWFLTTKEKVRINEITNKLKIQFEDYILNHSKLKSLLKPIRLDKNFTIKDIQTEFINKHRSKLQDDDYTYVAYISEIENYKFIFELENMKAYSIVPYHTHKKYEEKKEKYQNLIPNINKFIFNNIYRYKLIDIKKELDEIFLKSISDSTFTINYLIIENEIDKIYLSNENKFIEVLYLTNMKNYNYFEILEKFKYINPLKSIDYIENKIMKNIHFTTKYNNYIILELNKNQKLSIDIITTIKTENEIDEILLKTHFSDKKYKFLGELNSRFEFEKINDIKINTEEKFKSQLKKNFVKVNSEKNYYIFKETQINN